MHFTLCNLVILQLEPVPQPNKLGHCQRGSQQFSAGPFNRQAVINSAKQQPGIACGMCRQAWENRDAANSSQRLRSCCRAGAGGMCENENSTVSYHHVLSNDAVGNRAQRRVLSRGWLHEHLTQAHSEHVHLFKHATDTNLQDLETNSSHDQAAALRKL